MNPQPNNVYPLAPPEQRQEGRVKADTDNGYSRVANEMLDYLAEQDVLTKRQHRIVIKVIRKTYGWQKSFDELTADQIAEEIKYKHVTHIRADLRDLKKLGYVIEQGGEIGMNPVLSEWAMTAAEKKARLAKQTENCLPNRQKTVSGTDRKLSLEQTENCLKNRQKTVPTKDKKYITKQIKQNRLIDCESSEPVSEDVPSQSIDQAGAGAGVVIEQGQPFGPLPGGQYFGTDQADAAEPVEPEYLNAVAIDPEIVEQAAREHPVFSMPSQPYSAPAPVAAQPTFAKAPMMPMSADWEPSWEQLLPALEAYRISEEFARTALIEYRLYWLDDGTARRWQSHFLKHLCTSYRRHLAEQERAGITEQALMDRTVAQAKEITIDQPRSTVEKLTDRSWADQFQFEGEGA